MPNYTNLDSINKYYEGVKAPIESNMKQAQTDYDTNMANLKAQYDTSLNQSKANRQAELEKLLQGKETADAQAYRSLQRQLRTVPEAMSAAGGQGGMVDSGISFIKNRYLQGRNDRDVQLAGNNADVGRRYDDYDANLTSKYNQDSALLGRDYQNALEGYRGQLAQYEAQAAADRAELEYQQALAAAAAGGGGGGGGSSRRGRSYYGSNSGGGDDTTTTNSGWNMDTSSLTPLERARYEQQKARNKVSGSLGLSGNNLKGGAGTIGGTGGAGASVTASATPATTTNKNKSNLIDLSKYTKK